jgi:hypothetical protein
MMHAMRRFLLLLLLCLGLAGTALPMGAAPASPPARHDGMAPARHCGGEATCAHGACLGCALEPEAPRLRAGPVALAVLPMRRPIAVSLPSRSSALDPPPPRKS